MQRESESSFANRIDHLIKEHGFSIRSLAEAANIKPSTLHSWRTGTTPTDFAALDRLCGLLGCSFRWLLTGKPDAEGSGVPMRRAPFIFKGIAKVAIVELEPLADGVPEV